MQRVLKREMSWSSKLFVFSGCPLKKKTKQLNNNKILHKIVLTYMLKELYPLLGFISYD